MHIWEFSGAKTIGTSLQRDVNSKWYLSDETCFIIFSTSEWVNVRRRHAWLLNPFTEIWWLCTGSRGVVWHVWGSHLRSLQINTKLCCMITLIRFDLDLSDLRLSPVSTSTGEEWSLRVFMRIKVMLIRWCGGHRHLITSQLTTWKLVLLCYGALSTITIITMR